MIYIYMRLVQSTIDYIHVPLLYSFNSCFRSGIFPDLLKLAKVFPIFKKGSKLDIGNYRPISILSQISKILEKLCCNRLSRFLVNCDILPSAQYCFRRNISTSHALHNLDQNQFSMGIFIDLRKAFDYVSRQLFVKK